MSNSFKNLGLLFTKGISVEIWVNSGLIEREVKLYQNFLKNTTFGKIYWFTYGGEDHKYQHLLPKNIVIIPKPKFFNFRYLGDNLYSLLLPLIKLKYFRDCEIIKTNQVLGSWSGVISKLLLKKKLLVRTGYTPSINREKKFLYTIIEKIGYLFADKIIVSSEYQKMYLKKYNINLNKVFVIPNYVDIKEFKPNKSVIKKYDFIYVGRFSEEKNIFLILDSINKTNYNLTLVGDGILRKKIEQYIKKRDISNVRIIGRANNSELPFLLNSHKVYIQCSSYEGMPKTIIEAMSCSLPCIGTNVTGINEVIIDKKTGFLTELNTQDIVEKMHKLMNSDNLRGNLGKASRNECLRKYSFDAVLALEENIYKEI